MNAPGGEAEGVRRSASGSRRKRGRLAPSAWRPWHWERIVGPRSLCSTAATGCTSTAGWPARCPPWPVAQVGASPRGSACCWVAGGGAWGSAAGDAGECPAANALPRGRKVWLSPAVSQPENLPLQRRSTALAPTFLGVRAAQGVIVCCVEAPRELGAAALALQPGTNFRCAFSGLDKYVENRVCRKCPLCRSAYSSGTVEYVQELRSVVEVASSLLESRVRKRAQAMVDKIRHKQAQLNLQTTDVDRRCSPPRPRACATSRTCTLALCSLSPPPLSTPATGTSLTAR